MSRMRPRWLLLGQLVHVSAALVLRAPLLHRVADRAVALMTVTGRESGRAYTFPVSYNQRGNHVRVVVPLLARRFWWRNLRDVGAPVRMWIRGVERTGHAVADPADRGRAGVAHVELDPEAE